jgi:hypothetical protein
MASEAPGLRIPLIVDGLVILALAVQWGSNLQRMDQLERQIVELKAAQVSDGRVVRIEEKVQYLAEQSRETNALLRELVQQKSNGARR